VLSVDITYLLSRVQQTKPETSQINKEWLLDYSKANWFKATKQLDPLDGTIRSALENLMQGKSGLIPTSFIPPEPIPWAISHQHMCLVQHVLSRRQRDLNTTALALVTGSSENLERIEGHRLIPLAIQQLEEEFRRESLPGPVEHVFGIIFGIFDVTMRETDGYHGFIQTLLRSIALVMLQVLIMYTRSEIIACAMLRSVAKWVPRHLPLYMGQSPIALADRFNKSSDFLSLLSGEASAVGDIFQKETIVEHSTPLIRAFVGSNMKCVNFLLDYGADIEQADRLGMTILMHAVSENNTEVLSRLLQMGVGVEARDPHGWTALHHASGSPDALRCLLTRDAIGSVIDAQSRDGFTALHQACSTGCEASVTYLTDAGARIDLENDKGETVLDLLARKQQIGLDSDDEVNGDREKIRRMIRVISRGKQG
jgi:hypothetical protein